MFFHVSLSSIKNIIPLAKYVLPRNIPHMRSSWHLWHLGQQWQLWHLWVHVEWSNIVPINMCRPIKVWKNQPATQYQLGIWPNCKPEISNIHNYLISIMDKTKSEARNYQQNFTKFNSKTMLVKKGPNFKIELTLQELWQM